jgi:hypothetical protein
MTACDPLSQGPSSFFPRCYLMNSKEEIETFLFDYYLTHAESELKTFINEYQNTKSITK